MIYLENRIGQQQVWIPRNDTQGVPHKPSTELEVGNITVTADTQTNYPSSGYVGFSSVVIDATDYAQQNYEDGFDDGFSDGFASGSTEGYESGYASGYTSGYTSGETVGYASGKTDGEEKIIGTFTSATITENGQYGSSASPYSSVTVDVQPSLIEEVVTIDKDYTVILPPDKYQGYAKVEIDATQYVQDNYNSGYTSGETAQRRKLATTAFTANGNYTKNDGYSAVTVNVAQTGYTDQELEDAYESGYTSGSTDGYNSGYTSGQTDGFNSGYTSGETHQKSLLVSTAITENGSYQRENGYSAITVNVQTGQTYNIEPNKPFTATSNGDYTITPSIVSTSVEDEYIESGGSSIYQLTATTQGYPYVGAFNLFKVIDSEDQSKGYLDIKLVNGSIYWNSEDWYGGFPHLRGDNVIWFFGGSSSYTWTPLEDFNYSYDAMSAVTLNVNVPQTGHTDQELQDAYDSGYTSGYTSGETAGFNSGYTSGETDVISTFISTAVTENGVYGDSAHPLSSITVNVPQSGGGNVQYLEYIETDGTECIWDTGVKIEDIDEVVYFDLMPLTGSGHYDGWYAYIWGGQTDDYSNTSILIRNRTKNGTSFCYAFGANHQHGDYSGIYNFLLYDERNNCVFSKTGATIEVNGIETGRSVSTNSLCVGGQIGNVIINGQTNTAFTNVYRCQSARYYGFKIVSGDTAIIDLRPAFDNNEACFYDEVSQTYIHHIGSGTPIAGPVLDPSYQSGYTDGQNSIISTFTATAVTTNGVYGNSAHPLSSITVNVPQSGSFSSITLTANTAITSSEGGYSAITVNVPQTGISPVFLADYVHATTLSGDSSRNYLIDTGIYPTTGTTFRVKGMGKGRGQGNVIVGFYNISDSKDYRLFWHSTSGNNLTFDFNAQRLENNRWGGAYDGRIIDLTCSNYQVYDNISETVLLSGTQQTTMQDTSQTIKVDAGSWWLKSLEIYDENGNLVFDGQAAHDANGNGGLYDSISSDFKIPNGITLTYEPFADYAIGYTDGQSSIISTFTAATATTNGVYGSSANPLSAITVNVPQSGSTAILGEGSFSANGTYSASTDNLDGYSAITINVPTGTTQKDIVICTSGGCWFDTNYQFEYGDSVEAEHCTFGVSGAVPLNSSHCQLLAGDSGEIFRIGQAEENMYWRYFGNSVYNLPQLPSSGSVIEDSTIVFNSTAITVGGNVLTSYTTSSSSSKARLIVFANTKTGSDVTRNQTAKIGRIKIYGSEGTLKATFEPRLDELNVPYFKHIEEDIDIYASGNTAPFYEEIVISSLSSITITANTAITANEGGYSAITVNVDTASTFQSGYTSGYNDGYDTAFDDVESGAQTLSVTANGTYNTHLRADGYLWDEVVVNVPQTGGSSTLGDGYFTDNGTYSASTDNLDGYSSITIDVAQTGYTQQDLDDAFSDGYEQGGQEKEAEIVDSCISTSITQNGTYYASYDPYNEQYLWGEIVVNVPQTGYSINDLARRNYTIANPSITAITIEESAFGGCSGLTGNLELGSTVWFINKGAFCGSSISEIIWPQNIYGGPFSVTSMTMRNSLQFSECQNLEYVEVPNYVTFSGDSINASSGMFYNCQSLVNVDYYASRIPTHCFDGCIKLEYIYIDNITSIAQKAFYGCTHLTSIRFAQQNRPSVADYDAFTYVPSGGTLYVPFGRSSEYQPYLNFLTNWTIVEDAE